MHFFVPYDDSDLARVALREAYRLAGPLDDVTAMAAVPVPAYLPVDVSVREIWQAVFRAEWQLLEAQEYAERVARCGDTLRCVRVQARDRLSAIVAGVVHFHADTLLLAQSVTVWHRFAALFGDLPVLLRDIPCDIHMVYVAPEKRGSRYLDHPHDSRAVVRMSPFQQPGTAAICEDVGTPDSRIDDVIRCVRGAAAAHEPP